MDTHVRVLAILHLVLGALGVLAALALMAIFGGAAGLLGLSGDPQAAVALPIVGFTGTALVGLVLLLSLPAIIVGVGLLRFRPWARIGGIVLGVFNLIWIFPFGTLVGIYTLWVLFSSDTERLFGVQSLKRT
jgi:hypothetical protein